MSKLVIDVIGFLSQILFSSRLLAQWFLSEKQKKVVNPALFWILSLIASILLFVYGYLRNDFAIMFGQVITYFIYIRNLQLQNQWEHLPSIFKYGLYLIPILIIIYSFNNGIDDKQNLFFNENIPFWLIVLGIISQITFTLRFVYQWLYSEKNKMSVLPLGFWALSLIGSTLILIYAIIRLDKVLIIGHLFGSVIYIRNIILLRNEGN